LKLIAPILNLESKYKAMLADWKRSGEKLVPFVLEYDATNFEALITRCKNEAQGVNMPLAGRRVMVPHSTFWLTDQQNTILGVVNLRHTLNEDLRKIGGHIGYGIRPSMRRNGYATKILELALLEARKMGIQDVMLSCYKNNIGSSKSILNNGGTLAEEKELEGEIVQNYWIKKDSVSAWNNLE